MRLEVKRKRPQRRPLASKTNSTLGKAVTETCKWPFLYFFAVFSLRLSLFSLFITFLKFVPKTLKLHLNKGKGFESNFEKNFFVF